MIIQLSKLISNGKPYCKMTKNLLKIILGGLLVVSLLWIIISQTKSRKEPVSSISSHVEILESIESIGNLELVRMHMQDIMEHQLVRQWLPNAKAILIINGEAVGCIDLKKINQDNILISNDTISLLLPSPELCYCKINHEKSRVYDTQNNFFSGAKLIDEAYKEAEKHLRKKVLEAGILNETKENAILFFVPFFESLGFNHVSIMFEEDLSIINR